MEPIVKTVKNWDGSYGTIYQYDNEYIDKLFDINTSDTPDNLDHSEVKESIEYISQEEIGKKGNKSNLERYTDMIDNMFSFDED